MIYFLVGLLVGVLGARKYKTVINFVRDALVVMGITSPRPSNRIAKGRDRLQKNPVPAEIPDPKRERVAVLLTAGQSNAANHGAVGESNDHRDNPAILNLLDGKCYIARHPLLGATGEDQSPWIETARLLLASGKFDKIVIIATGIGGTGMSEWTTGTEFHERMLRQVRQAQDCGLPITHFLWHQGESDGVYKRSAVEYLANLKAMIHSLRKVADVPAVIALATRCREHGPNEDIRQAQADAARELKNIHAIDSDALGLAYRYDGCHFSKSGQNELAKLYADQIIAM